MAESTTEVTLTLSVEIARELRFVAARQGLSESQLAERVLRSYFGLRALRTLRAEAPRLTEQEATRAVNEELRAYRKGLEG